MDSPQPERPHRLAETMEFPTLALARFAAGELRRYGYGVSVHRGRPGAWMIVITGPPHLMRRLRDDAGKCGPERFDWRSWVNGLPIRAVPPLGPWEEPD
jgi:hypothetical protein